MKYYLNCNVCYCKKNNEWYDLFVSEKESNNLSELEELLDNFDTSTSTCTEFSSKGIIIKYSISIYEDLSDNELKLIKEKCFILDLQEYCNDFWKIANRLENYN